MKNYYLIFFFSCCCAATIVAQPTLLKDINPGSESSFTYPDNARAQMGNSVYFTASQPDSGTELWKTDGSSAGTVLVKDINPGATGSELNNFYVLADTLLLFTANDGVNGKELWRSNGTAAGTVMVKNIGPNSYSGITDNIGNPKYYHVYKGKLYFSADNEVSGFELWSSDGTEAGTTLVKDINTSFFGSFPVHFETHNDLLFFVARNGAQGEELWKTDGSSAGTVLVKDIYTGVSSSSPSDLLSLGNVLIFRAEDNTHDNELWRSDGTAAGTVLVKDIKTNTAGTFSPSGFETQPNSFEKRFVRVGDIAFFAAIDDSHGKELWKTDGTEAGTVMVKDVSSAADNGYAPQNFAVLGNEVFYKYNNGVNGIELWKSDGTASGTTMLRDIYPGSFSSFSLPSYVYTHQDKVFFGAEEPSVGIELFASTGQINGTQLLANINPGSSDSWPSFFFSFGQKLLFWATTNDNGTEPWIYQVPLSLSEEHTNIFCFGEATGSITLSPSGTPPYTATWEPSWVAGLAPSGLPAGTYAVTLTDADGATASTTIVINEPAPILTNFLINPATGTSANGSASIFAFGGVPPYNYLWSTGATTQHALNLSAGFYSCTVTDVNGCQAMDSVQVLNVVKTQEAQENTLRARIFPNPVSAYAQFDIEGGGQVLAGNILDASGRLVRVLETGEIAKKQMETSRLPSGYYRLVLELPSNKVAMAPFVVQR